MRQRGWKQTTIGTMMGIVFLLCVAAPGVALAEDDVKLLKQRLEQMSQEMEAVQKKLKDIEWLHKTDSDPRTDRKRETPELYSWAMQEK